MSRRRLWSSAIVLSLLAVGCTMRPHTPGEPAQAPAVDARPGIDIASRLEARQPRTKSRLDAQLWSITRQFYQKRDETPAWFDGRHPNANARALVTALASADREGLDPSRYAQWIPDLDHGLDRNNAGNPADADISLTLAYLHYAGDLSGTNGPPTNDPNWRLAAPPVDLGASLAEATSGHGAAAALGALAPTSPDYLALRDALARYRHIADNGGWQPVRQDLRLKPNQSDATVPDLARRLAATGDYRGAVDARVTQYGTDLQAAVRGFQQRHGLEPDGIVRASTVAELNVPVERRIQQIELNLERMRWLPRSLGDRYVLVNLPEYRLEVRDHGAVPVVMRVVVGKHTTPTPVFRGEMVYLVFSPYWNVPSDIVQKETLPSALKDPSFLERTHMEIVDRHGRTVDPSQVDLEHPAAYRFRQRPGPGNSLGLVKFMFPNAFNVYLHGTPARSLFARAARSFSHGCVRLQEPEQLADYVLADQPEWTQARIHDAMRAGEEKTVKLSQPLPVYLVYWTARVDRDGLVQFRSDIYGHDLRQSAWLDAGQTPAGPLAHSGTIVASR